MSDDRMRMVELSLQGFGCAQVLALLALEAMGKENPELVRAVSGLHGGAFSGKLCGALTGGCCVLALHAGRGTLEESQGDRLVPMIQELVEGFEEEYAPRFGGIDCASIVGNDPRNRVARCPELVAAVHEKVQELLKSERP